jgi:hypothetical protein
MRVALANIAAEVNQSSVYERISAAASTQLEAFGVETSTYYLESQSQLERFLEGREEMLLFFRTDDLRQIQKLDSLVESSAPHLSVFVLTIDSACGRYAKQLVQNKPHIFRGVKERDDWNVNDNPLVGIAEYVGCVALVEGMTIYANRPCGDHLIWSEIADRDRMQRLRDNPRSVFISYGWKSQLEKAFAVAVYAYLKSCGFDVVLDSGERLKDPYALIGYGLSCNNAILIVTEDYLRKTGLDLKHNPQGKLPGFVEGVSYEEVNLIGHNLKKFRKVITLYRSGSQCLYDFPVVDCSNHHTLPSRFRIIPNMLESSLDLQGKRFDEPWVLDWEGGSGMRRLSLRRLANDTTPQAISMMNLAFISFIHSVNFQKHENHNRSGLP